jgi:hypothetical protein
MTAGPLRYALSKNISKSGPRNCRSLGFARDDKGEGDASMKSGCWTKGVRTEHVRVLVPPEQVIATLHERTLSQ